MRFASLASGSSGNCLVAEAAGTVVLVDCGLALTETERRLARFGLEPSRVSAILITHEHGDHAGGAFEFAAAHRVSVYLTHGTLAALKAEGKVLDGVPLLLVNGRQSFFVDGIQLLPFTVPHDAREPVQYVLSDGAARLGVITDVGISTAYVEKMLSGLDALVLECNYDYDMLWNGGYPRWLKERIAGPFGHLDNLESERLLGAIDRSRLKHVIGAHLSQQNNRPGLARAALARALGCEESWVSLATQDEGFDWRSI
ncbi:MAG TPA: MBL fold metallo-hydrolase [Burkholderiales bacterium]|nr:MBL fold metallo-hydrolase [Burkholderiales bacterium]